MTAPPAGNHINTPPCLLLFALLKEWKKRKNRCQEAHTHFCINLSLDDQVISAKLAASKQSMDAQGLPQTEQRLLGNQPVSFDCNEGDCWRGRNGQHLFFSRFFFFLVCLRKTFYIFFCLFWTKTLQADTKHMKTHLRIVELVRYNLTCPAIFCTCNVWCSQGVKNRSTCCYPTTLNVKYHYLKSVPSQCSC